MNRLCLLLLIGIIPVVSIVSLRSEEEGDLRIALDESFPDPRGAAYFAGEITLVEHVNRRGILRLDRDGTINKYFWDLPHHFQMLPYGAIYYHGAPAELKDVPVGTHLHGKFYLGPEGDFPVVPPETEYAASKMARPNLRSVESRYSRVFQLEDDFSFYQRQDVGWKIKAIADDVTIITAETVALSDGSSMTSNDEFQGMMGEKVFRIDPGTRIWKGRGIGGLGDLAVGQVVALNLGWVSLLGAERQEGICRDIWIDEESREVAAGQQRQIHIAHHRRRGVPAKVIETESLPGEGARGYVTFQIHGGVDQELLAAFKEKGGAAVWAAEPSLRTYGNDSKPGSAMEISRIENPPAGSSGLQIRMHFYEMLEGYRPGRTVRMAPGGWKLPERPREERLWPNDMRIFSVGPKPVADRDAPVEDAGESRSDQ